MMKNGIIGIEGLGIQCVIGCDEEERRAPQTVLVDIRLEYDFSHVTADDLHKTVDYIEVAHVAEETAKKKFYLIESLAMAITSAIMKKFPHVASAYIKIVKPHYVQVKGYFVEYTQKR